MSRETNRKSRNVEGFPLRTLTKSKHTKIMGLMCDRSISCMRMLRIVREKGLVYIPSFWLNFSAYPDVCLKELAVLVKHNMSTKDVELMCQSLQQHRKVLSHVIYNNILDVLRGRTPVPESKKWDRSKFLLQEDGEYHAQFCSFTHKHVVDIPALHPIVQQVSNGISGSPTCRKFVSQLTICVVSIIHNSDTVSRVLAIMSFLNTFDCVGSWVEKYAQGMAQVFQFPSTKFEAHASVDIPNETLFTGTVKLLSNVLSVTTPASLALETKRMKRLEGFSKTCTTISRGLLYLKELLVTSFKYVRAYALGVDVNLIDLLDADLDILDWQEQLNDIILNDGILLASRDPNVASKIQSLYRVGCDFEQSIIRSKIPRNVALPFYKNFDRLNNLMKETLAFSGFDRVRPSPFVVHIFGESGIGKSTMLNFLLTDVYAMRGTPFDPKYDIYVRNAVQNFWDGYKNQKVTLFDDFLQSQIDEDLAQALVELVRCKNTLAFPLPMASLEQKGNSRFTSEFVYISSNKDFPPCINCLSDINAVRRRRDLVIRAVIKPEFSNKVGGIDNDKVNAYMQKHYEPLMVDGVEQPRKFSRDVYNFQLFSTGKDANPGVMLNEVLSWDDLIHRIVRDWDALLRHERAFEVEVAEGTPKSIEYYEAQAEEDSYLSVLRDVAKHPSRFLQSSIHAAYFSGFEKIDDIKDPLVTRWNKICEGSHAIEKMDALSKYIQDKVKAHPAYAVVGGLLSSCLVAYGIWKTCFSMSDEFVSEHVSGDSVTKYRGRQVKTDYRSEHMSGDSITRYRGRKISSRAEAKIIRGFEPINIDECFAHASADVNGLSVMRRKIGNNQMLITVTTDGVSLTLGGFMVAGRAFLCPAHTLLKVKPQSVITIRKTGNSIVVEGAFSEFVRCDIPKTDLCILICPRRTPCFPDIRSHISDGDFSHVDVSAATLLTLVDDGYGFAHYQIKLSTLDLGGSFTYNADGIPIVILRHFKYLAEMEYGDCGSAIFILNKACQRKFVGIHVAGCKSVGIAVPLDVNLINKALEGHDYGVSIRAPDCLPDHKYEAHSVTKDCRVLSVQGHLPPRYQQRQPTKTEIRKSVLYEKVYPAVTAPCKLSPGLEYGNPLGKNIDKMDVDIITFPTSLVHRALEDLRRTVKTYSFRSTVPRLLTMREAINGDPSDDHVKSLNMSTSSGFPFIHMRACKSGGKRGLFVGEEGNYRPCGVLQSYIDRRLEAAKNNEVVPVLFLDILKDERRPFRKVEEGSTRLFSVGPLDLNILVRMYFMKFVSYLQHNCVFGECSVGLTPTSSDWKLLYEHLCSNSRNFIVGDYGAYDKILPYQLIDAVYDVIYDFYGEDDNKVRRVLYDSVFQCYHVAGRSVYRAYGGNPSGNPLTVIINSLVNSLLVRLAYFTIYPCEMECFSNCVVLKTFGDDVLMSVHRDRQLFNFQTLQNYLQQNGITFTMPNKTSETCLYFSDSEITYLKRSFRHEQSLMYCPLEWDSITEMINWIRDCPDHRGALRDNIMTVKRELFQYGEEIYEKHQKLIDSAAQEVGLLVAYVPYSVFLQERLSESL